MRQQLELVLPRKRVALADVLDAPQDTPQPHMVGIAVDLSTGPIIYTKNGREGELVDGVWIDYTDWLEGPPPCDGWWHIRGENATVYNQRTWWNSARGEYSWETMQHGALVQVTLSNAKVFYRGLSLPAPAGYVWFVPGAKTRCAAPSRRVLLEG